MAKPLEPQCSGLVLQNRRTYAINGIKFNKSSENYFTAASSNGIFLHSDSYPLNEGGRGSALRSKSWLA